MPPAAIFLSTAKEIWKRTPPKTDGFWISLSSNCNCGAKRFRTGSPALLSPLPLLRTAFERPQWAHPAHTYLAMSPVAHPRRGRRPRRPVFRSPIAGCTRVLLLCLRRPYFFQQRKKYGKERRQKPSVFGFPFRPIVTAVQKGPHRIACTPIPAAAPAYRAKTFFSRTVQRKCFTSYILLYSAARRAAPIYHSLPENATRSRVPRLTAPNGHTPPTRISPCLRSRTP